MTRKYWIIKDWAGNLCFHGRRFVSFENGEAWLCEKLGEAYETDRGEYYTQLEEQ